MKSFMASSIFSIAMLSSYALAANVVTMNIGRTPASSQLSRRYLSPRATISETLFNNFTGGSYVANVTVGTPPQTISLIIDTGSSDVWLLDSTADLCTNAEEQDYYGGGCSTTFDSAKSSTFKIVDAGGFTIQYQDQSGASGNYISDTFSIGGATIKGLEMGLAYNTTVPSGLMGIGYDTNEASNSPYPNIIDQMFNQSLINTKAYSLYLDDYESSTGSIIFGGVDTDKYHGALIALPTQTSTDQDNTKSKIYIDFTVAFTNFSVTGQTGSTTTLTSADYAQPAILDSGTTITYLPSRLASSLFKLVDAVDDTSNTGNVYVNCDLRTNSPTMTFNFGFGGSSGPTVKVPVSELVFYLTGIFQVPAGYDLPNLPFHNVCALGIQSADGGPNLFGDTFLRSAYVVYDLTNNQIAIAQTNFNSTTSNVVEFEAGATSIPNVSGVASSVSVTQTATGQMGAPGKTQSESATGKTSPTSTKGSSGGSKTTAAGIGTGTGAATTTSTHANTAVGSVPALDMSSLVVLAISGTLAVLGGSWFLA